MIAVEVKLWGTTIGALSMQEGESAARFEYAPGFIGAGVEPSPIRMPVSVKIYSFPELSQTFKGLPGLFADSIPDKFGNKLIDSWLIKQGRDPASFTALERLCYTGNRGMGALEFYPTEGPAATDNDTLDVENLRNFAASVLNQRKSLKTQKQQSTFEQILRVGTSAGGARAKVLIAYDESTGEIRSGQVANSENFSYWLLKLDDVENNSDKEKADVQGYGPIEYTYYQMAQAAGIQMSECRLLEKSGHRHFMTRRFDRLAGGKKLHYQSLCALAHYDFNMAGAYSYEQAFMVIKQLGLGYEALEQMFRRAVFNICARNQDDHAKNIGFLMNKRGEWSLAPAFDMTYAYNPGGLWTGSHQMTFNGKRDNFTIDDFKAVARFAGLKQGRHKKILGDVQEAVSAWPKLAKKNDVNAAYIKQIKATHRTF
ncbi:type II toxin-antitoxin system HipA family toxin [Fibrobacter sp.]|uniref:type II toxin-antitoxin system HipA family toxin n=1 Tax=Fibrobacter sp. TaxID=35828 RepID=UPI003890382E